jgi:D-alanine-D-alanine ligase-like ATP-grasp enzyme
MTSTSLLPMAAKSAGVDFNNLIDIILNMAILDND